MTKTKSLVLAMLLPLVANAAKVTLPTPPPSQFADSEAATNGVVCAVGPGHNRFRLSIELDAATNNCVLVEFGVDANDNGTLEREEVEFVVGWDCGEWVYRDSVAGVSESAASPPGRRSLDWVLSFNPDKSPKSLLATDGSTAVFQGPAPMTFFNLAWDTVRVVRRGAGTVDESACCRAFAAPSRIILM